MKFFEGAIYHVYNRGNKQQKIFFTRENFRLFLKKARTEFAHNCEILTYSLMPNHFHFIVRIKTRPFSKHKNLNNAIGCLLRSYTRAMQKQENFTGSLFQQKTKAKELMRDANDDSEYLIICAHYIHRNPKYAGLVDKMEDWEHSSYRDYVGLTKDGFCAKESFYNIAKITAEKFMEQCYRINC